MSSGKKAQPRIHTDTYYSSAFKFLPVLGEYLALGIKKKLPVHLANKWRFRKDYEHQPDAFLGDGSRGGPERRELNDQERAKLDGQYRAKL